MAEAGSVETTKKSSIDSRLLECPICLEQLKTPKSLPCLHSFCQECLSTYITKDISGQQTSSSSFSCPVCRKTTHPVNASENKSVWAKQFPTNNLATEMIQLKVSLDKPYLCMPCQNQGGSETAAVFWCKMNKTLLCETCKVDLHDKIHYNCDIITITEEFTLAQSQELITIKCEKHKKKMEYFCEDHQFIGCSKCITIDHRRCEVVTTTEEYCEKLTYSSQLDDREKSLEGSKDCMETISKNLDEEFHILANDREAALKSISDQRKKINQYLDGKQQEITDDLTSKVKDRNDLLDVSRQKCDRLKIAIAKTLESSKISRMKKKDMETVLLFQRGQMEIESCKDLVAEMTKSFSAVRVKHAIEPDHTSILSMGTIVIDQSNMGFEIDGGISSTPLSARKAIELRKINIKCPTDQTDCCSCGVAYLPDSQIVLSDKNNEKLKLFSETGKCLDEMRFTTGELWDMCLVDNNKVAVATSENSEFYVVEVQSSKLMISNNIKNTSGGCYSITYTGESFIVSYGGIFYSVSKDGQATQIYSNRPTCWHHGYYKGHIFTANSTIPKGEAAVSRLKDGTVTDILKVDVLSQARGIDIDKEGNVYVCGSVSNNIIQMSEDGTNIRELLTSSDGIKQPRAISVCGDKFVVTNASPEQRNYMQIFQLV